MNGRRDRFVRFGDLESGLSSPSDSGQERCEINVEGSSRAGHAEKTTFRGFRKGLVKGSEGLKSIGHKLGFGGAQAVFPEFLDSSGKKIFDPQDKLILSCNKLFFIICIVAVYVDPLFFYLPVINDSTKCLGIDRKLAIVTTTLRTIIDAFYLVRMALQFRQAYSAPSPWAFGRGRLVMNLTRIARRYLTGYFIVDFLAVLPLPQIIVWRFLPSSKGLDVLTTKQALFFAVLLQYIPRFVRFIPIASEMKRTVGVFAESAWAGAGYYLLLYMLASHIVGALWYSFALERNDACWQKACKGVNGVCDQMFLYCGNQNMQGYDSWATIRDNSLKGFCTGGDNSPFDFGIYKKALSSHIISSSMKFVSKYFYCLWWGLQNLSTLGQGLETSTHPGEIIFCLALAVFGLILFALLIGNMQAYLRSQSDTVRLEEEIRVKRRATEQWMRSRMLPRDLREQVRRYERYNWLKTRGVDEETLLQSLPKYLRREIKRHFCQALVRSAPPFENMDERLLDAFCERLKPCLFTKKTYVVREGDPIDEMLFIISGRLESVTNCGRIGYFNCSVLKEGDFCGEELLTWALDPKSGANLPTSTRTLKAWTEVEAFTLTADELKSVGSLFRQLHSRKVQHTFRFYSQQWRTWAACFIQAAWRRYSKKKHVELLKKLEDARAEAAEAQGSCGTGAGGFSIHATFLASRFAANALRGVHRNRNAKIARELVKLQKPSEPDFTAEDSD